MSSIVSTTTEYRDRTRVEIENLMPWSVGFQTYTLVEKNGAIVNGGSYDDKGNYQNFIYRQLTLEEIITQISINSKCFVGIDGKGSHACFRIRDLELYKVAFDLPDATDFPIQLTQAAIEKLININDPKKFKKELEELVVTPSEKKAFAYFLVNHKRVNELPLSLLKYIEDYTEMNIINA